MILKCQQRMIRRSLDELPLKKQLEIYERNAAYTSSALKAHCLLKAAQIRQQLADQIDYYKVITDATLSS